jgi:hypothetical protein
MRIAIPLTVLATVLACSLGTAREGSLARAARTGFDVSGYARN